MSSTQVRADNTEVFGVTGAASYHALLAVNGDAPFTLFVNSVVGTTKEEVASVGGGGGATPILLIPQVFKSRGLGQDYEYDAAAVTAAGAVLHHGLSAPALVRDGARYKTTFTYFDFDSVPYLSEPPFDSTFFIGSLGSPAPLFQLKATIEEYRAKGGSSVLVQGSAIVRKPSLHATTLLLVQAMQGWFSQFPPVFDVTHETSDLTRILGQIQLDTYQRGSPMSGAISEPEIRAVVLAALEKGARGLQVSFGNPVDAERILGALDRLKTGTVSGVRNARAVRDAPSPVSPAAFRSRAFDLLEDLIETFGHAIGDG